MPDADYALFLESIRMRFSTVANPLAAGPLFTTDAVDLFNVFLAAIPEPDRQHHTCHACRRFVNTYGSLVTIDRDGVKTSALWSAETTPTFWYSAVSALARAVGSANVIGVHFASEKVWGTPVTGDWHHMAVSPPRSLVYAGTLKTAFQAEAEKREDYNILVRSLVEFPAEAVAAARTYLSNGSLYRSEKCLGVAAWLDELHKKIASVNNRERKNNLVWQAVATAPAGYCHVRSTMIGTLLEDIVANLPFASIKVKFDAKMAPDQYARAQVAPSSGQIAQAERVIAQLDAAGSLARRFARIEEVQTIWKPQERATPSAAGVFAGITPRETQTPAPLPTTPTVTMTWEKFARTVLPEARVIEARVPETPERFAALVTAVHPDAPPILQWDNPVSWYYHAGIDAEIKRRVTAAGGQYDNVDIRASLIWHNRNDLDLHVITPAGEHIYFGNKRSHCGGWLDVDMNVRGETTEPVENTRWARGTASPGVYSVYVENFAFHEVNRAGTPFTVELEVNGDVYAFSSTTPAGRVQNTSRVSAFAFNYTSGHRLAPPLGAVRTSNTSWGVAPNTWAKVTGISTSPNLWSTKPLLQHGRHMFFLLDGCRDMAEGRGRGFFTETLRGEYREISRTLEAYAANTPVADSENATACGLGMTDQRPWNLTLRVTPKSGPAVVYTLDRWD